MKLGDIIEGEFFNQYIKAAIEINLRLPSMVKGKPGFERIRWAFRNVLNRTVTWLLCNINARTDGTGPIAIHQPLVRSVQPSISPPEDAIVPAFPETLEEADHSLAAELLEWLTLLASNSPRVYHNDGIDPYLSRYSLPGALGEGGDAGVQRVVRIRWHGFLHATFVSKIFLIALKACGGRWFSLCTTAVGHEAYTILHSEGRTMTWEYED
ncbi:hypothetical protein LTR53_017356 [Teratosphaeriaceae sp. CCFEE 6253]|nr:hypothetical protein LTR53_017356 [Teratosphaeriaceae sp. CCFEE 6253]